MATQNYTYKAPDTAFGSKESEYDSNRLHIHWINMLPAT